MYAVKHAIQIIGEAANKLSDETIAKYNEAPWKEIVGMRNKIVHDYFGLNVRLIWKTIKEDMLPLKSVVIKILEDNTIN